MANNDEVVGTFECDTGLYAIMKSGDTVKLAGYSISSNYKSGTAKLRPKEEV